MTQTEERVQDSQAEAARMNSGDPGGESGGAAAGAPGIAAGAASQAPARTGAAHSIRVCFGRCWVSHELVNKLQAGSVLELDCEATSPAEVIADGRPSGLGTPVVVEGRLGIRMETKA